MRIEKIKIDAILHASNRTYGGEGDIKILAADMKENGLINPITVKDLPEEKRGGNPDKVYEAVAGRRRLDAAISLGWEDILACVLEGDEVNRADEIAGSENINRLAMHPLDEAIIFAKMLENGQSVDELAKRYDRKASAIWQRVQLLDLDNDIKTLFRNGNLSLHSAAMLKSLSDETQKAFYKQFKNDPAVEGGEVIEDWQIKRFISNLDYDKLYVFLKDKQCAGCKTRTYFGDKNLFPELDDVSDSCLNHDCYMEKWATVLASRIKSLKGEYKSHAAAALILHESGLEKITGKKITIDGAEYSVLPWRWNTEAKAKDKGALPCFHISMSASGKLEIKPEYWKKSDEAILGGVSASPASKRKDFAPIVNVLDMPKAETEETLDALSNRKRLTAAGLGDNVRDSVFWRIMEMKKQEFDDPQKADSASKEAFLKKHFHYLHGNGRKVFEMFVGKMAISDIAKLPPGKVFLLLAAMEWAEHELVNPVDFEKGKPCDILKWAGIPNEQLRQLYKEEISRRMPKKPGEKKAEKQKPDVIPDNKKSEKSKTSGAKKTTGTKTTAPRKKLPTAKKIAAVNAAKGKEKRNERT